LFPGPASDRQVGVGVCSEYLGELCVLDEDGYLKEGVGEDYFRNGKRYILSDKYII
jgi:hypothetical protein